MRLDRLLARQPMALQLDIEPIGERARRAGRGAPPRDRVWPLGDGAVDRAARAAGQRDQPVGRTGEPRQGEVGADIARRSP